MCSSENVQTGSEHRYVIVSFFVQIPLYVYVMVVRPKKKACWDADKPINKLVFREKVDKRDIITHASR